MRYPGPFRCIGIEHNETIDRTAFKRELHSPGSNGFGDSVNRDPYKQANPSNAAFYTKHYAIFHSAVSDVLWQQIAALQSQNRFLYTGNRYLPEVALTFDDGPNPYYTPQILAIIRHSRVKVTFFCIGRQVARYPDLVRQEYNDGNLVGNHSWSHPNLALLSNSEIESQIKLTSDAIQQATGVRPTFFRPPYGVVNTRVLAQVNLLGLTAIIWNDEARDSATLGTSVIVSRILRLAGDGAIILLHDGGGDRSQTIAALPFSFLHSEQ